MKELTKAEEQAMKYLWKLKTAYLKDIVSAYPAPCPAYTTVSTVVNVLVKKGFIGFETHGKSRAYHPLISQANYRKHAFGNMLSEPRFRNTRQNLMVHGTGVDSLVTVPRYREIPPPQYFR